MFAQLGFGFLAVVFGGLIGGEATLNLTRQLNEALLCEYRFELYGKFPLIRKHVDDLVEVEFREGIDNDQDGPMEQEVINHAHLFKGRSGDSFAVGNAFSLFEIKKMIESDAPRYEHRIVASKGRRTASFLVGGFGAILLLGFLCSLFRFLKTVSKSHL